MNKNEWLASRGEPLSNPHELPGDRVAASGKPMSAASESIDRLRYAVTFQRELSERGFSDVATVEYSDIDAVLTQLAIAENALAEIAGVRLKSVDDRWASVERCQAIVRGYFRKPR